MSNGSVHVTVDSSAVAAAVSRLKGDIRDVAGEVRGVTGSIQIMRDKLISQMGQNGQRLDAVKNEVTRSIDAAALSKLVETATEIFAKIGLIESSKKRILQEYYKSIVRCGRTSDKFDRLNDEVKASYHIDVRRLGKYIFDIWYNHYQAVEDRIDKQHTGFLTTMEQSVEQIRKKREQELEGLFKAVTGKLEHFLAQRRTFHQTISMITAGKLDAPLEKIAIPMIIVKKTGAETSQIKIGSEMEPGVNEHLGYRLRETEIFKTYRSEQSTLDQYIRWREMTAAELKQLEENLGQLLKKKQISREYHELLVRGLKKNPPKAAEGFEMPRSGENLHDVIHPPVEEPGVRQIEIELDDEPYDDEPDQDPGENEQEEEEIETREEEES
jgi:hypothetical protein